ncbi:hypothetical protein FRC03_006080 [Tulasnella sp. 419]|nr:hypothetical protein FRC03_006080 [Tulasnella sp. 419]
MTDAADAILKDDESTSMTDRLDLDTNSSGTTNELKNMFYRHNENGEGQDVRDPEFADSNGEHTSDSSTDTDMEFNEEIIEQHLSENTATEDVQTGSPEVADDDAIRPRPISTFDTGMLRVLVSALAKVCWIIGVFILSREEMRRPLFEEDEYNILVGKGELLLARSTLLSHNMEGTDDVINCYRQALLLPYRKGYLPSATMLHMAQMLMLRWMTTNNDRDMDEAIHQYRKALSSGQLDEEHQFNAQVSLAGLVQIRFKLEGNAVNLQEAVYLRFQALWAWHLKRSHRLPILNSLRNRIRVAKGQSDGVTGPSTLHGMYRPSATDLASRHPKRRALHALAKLASKLMKNYRLGGHAMHLEGAADCHRVLLSVQPLETRGRAFAMRNLADSLRARYELFGDHRDIQQSIHYYSSLIHQPLLRYLRISVVSGLADSAYLRFKATGDKKELKRVIGSLKFSLLLRDSKKVHSMTVTSLANCLVSRCELRGRPGDLDDALGYLRTALIARQMDHHDRAYALNSLANALMVRFDHRGDLEDLQEAISVSREVSQTLPSGHAKRTLALANLGQCLHHRYKELGDPNDLDEAIGHHREAMNNFALGFIGPIAVANLNDLAVTLKSRFRAKGKIDDLQEAIGIHEKCLQHAASLSYFDPLPIIHNIGLSYRARYRATGNPFDIIQAVVHFMSTIQRAAGEDPRLGKWTYDLASTLIKHARGGDIATPMPARDLALELFQRCVTNNAGSIRMRFKYSYKWAIHAEGANQVLAYKTCLDLANQYLLMRPSVVSRHQLLARVPRSIGCDAAACAIGMGQVTTAVELLEQGKTLLWSQIGRYRTPLDKLQKVNRGLAYRFKQLSQQLDESATSPRLANTARLSVEQMTRRIGRDTRRWEETIKKIRELEGFSTFLMPKSFEELKLSSTNGPVIMLSISKSRCDAIILHDIGQVVLLPLPDLSLDHVDRLAREFVDALSATSDRARNNKITMVLRCLWNDIVKHIVDCLRGLKVLPRSRIWWCPTSSLAMLPLHAAGPYRRNEPNLPDIYISSYTPTLLSLIDRSDPPTSDSSIPALLLVGQPEAPKQLPIPGVREEVKTIQRIVPDSNLLLDENASSEAVLSGLKTHRWIHFASHGSQDLSEPFNSCFYLRDRPLRLIDIIQAHLPDAEFAFLSACHSAAGDKNTPDETIHLAAALQFCGFKSVIGTMYPMADKDGPIVAEEVYKHMFRRCGMKKREGDGGEVDYRDAAEALNIATRVLRDNGVPAYRWINYVHYGA